MIKSGRYATQRAPNDQINIIIPLLLVAISVVPGWLGLDTPGCVPTFLCISDCGEVDTLVATLIINYLECMFRSLLFLFILLLLRSR